MSASEKRELRERLVSYMEYHPLSGAQKMSQKNNFETEDTVVKVFHLNKWKFLQWSGTMFASLLLIVPYVAERSMPGDALYAVKINLNEELRSTLARSSYEKVVWETERLNRRIAEARLLVSAGKMTDEMEESVAKAVHLHNENARKEIENIKQVDEEEAMLASIQLATTLDIQSTSLRSSQQVSTTTGNNTNRIVDVLDRSQTADMAAVDLPSYERLIGRVERETTRAYELLSSVKESATSDEKVNIKRRLEDIERKTAVAISDFENSEVEARKQLVDVLQQTQRLIVFMTNIDVRNTLTVDEIVPVTPTREERLTKINQQIEESLKYIEYIELTVTATSTATTSMDVKEKAQSALVTSKTRLSDVVSRLESENSDLLEIEGAVNDTRAVMEDIRSLLGVNREAILELSKLRKESRAGTSTPATSTKPSSVPAETIEGTVGEP